MSQTPTSQPSSQPATWASYINVCGGTRLGASEQIAPSTETELFVLLRMKLLSPPVGQIFINREGLLKRINRLGSAIT